MFSPLHNLALLRSARSRRVSSYDRSGGNSDKIEIKPGETAVLADIAGAGCVRHIWCTFWSDDPMIRRNAVLRMYWDGQSHPSVESPIGDFFGQGWGENYNFASLPLVAAPKEGRALNCWFPMPFARGARIELENQSEKSIPSFYYYVDYEDFDPDARFTGGAGGSAGDADPFRARPASAPGSAPASQPASAPALLPGGAIRRYGDWLENAGRFHAWWNREWTDPYHEDGVEHEWNVFGKVPHNQSDAHNYLLCEPCGRGHYVGVNYFVDSPTPIWPGEGDDMFRIDGEPWPGSLHGTGTEDYFCCSWSPVENFQHPYFGYARVNNRESDYLKNSAWLGRTHCYRFHIEDPIHFAQSLRASIEHGHANGLALDIASVAYWYQTLPGRPFAPLPPRDRRQNMPAIGAVDIHRWREAWRQGRGGGKLWGNEK